MQKLSRWPILTLLIIAALVSYSIGFIQGMGFFLLLGGLFELSFLVKLFKTSS